MKVRYVVLFVLALLGIASCSKNTMSKIPQIYLMNFYPDSSLHTVLKENYDTAFILFHLQDGDADLGNDPNSTNYDIFLKDSRYDTGYVGYHFPPIDAQVEDASKGIEGTCLFVVFPGLVSARNDSIHTVNGDTLYYEMYIVDRAGHQSNHIYTPRFIIKP